MSSFTIAAFCDIKGDIYVNGDRFWLCRKHGNVKLVPYYGFAKAEPLSACPKCIEDHLDNPTVPAVSKLRCSVEGCKARHDVKRCTFCHQEFCAEHRKADLCEDCHADMENIHRDGWNGA